MRREREEQRKRESLSESRFASRTPKVIFGIPFQIRSEMEESERVNEREKMRERERETS